MNDDSTDLKIALAVNAHDAWSRWTTHLLNQCSSNEDGSMTIPSAAVERWKRQIATPYNCLTDQEQASDLREADLILQIVAGAEGESDASLL